jgi:uncharacterized protein (DUF1778 family)
MQDGAFQPAGAAYGGGWKVGTMERTALLIRCTTDEAARIRIEAEKQRRTISAYVLQITIRAITVEDRMFSKMSAYQEMNQVLSKRTLISPGPRTAILVRCGAAEAERIREAARRRDMPINAFVLQALKRAWTVDISAHSSLNATTEAPRQLTPPS